MGLVLPVSDLVEAVPDLMVFERPDVLEDMEDVEARVVLWYCELLTMPEGVVYEVCHFPQEFLL